MLPNYPDTPNNAQPPQGITSKELNLISDSLNSEELLCRLCAHSATQVSDQELRHNLEQMARERLQHFDQLMMIVKQQTGYLH